MNVQQLLQFCAYFHLNKQAAGLPLSKHSDANDNQEIKRKPEKTNRKKIQVIETNKPKSNKLGKIQKVVKPKVQNVHKEERSRIISKNQQNHKQKHGLEYFMNHLKGDPQSKAYNDSIWKPTTDRKHQTSNYDTFGTKQRYFQPYSILKQPYHSPSPSPPPQHIYNNLSQKSHALFTTPQIRYPSQQNSILQKQASRRYQEAFNQYDFPRYSPIKNEELSISRRNAYSPIASQRSLSKTRSKNKNTRIQRPFYDPIRLRPLESRESEISNNRAQNTSNSLLSSSLILNEQNKIRASPKKQGGDQKRQTAISMVTVNKNEKSGKYSHENELDDQMFDIVGPLIHKNITNPIAVSLNPQYKKY